MLRKVRYDSKMELLYHNPDHTTVFSTSEPHIPMIGSQLLPHRKELGTKHWNMGFGGLMQKNSSINAISRQGIMEHNGRSTRQHAGTKVDPSFKSKRYRDKLRAEVKALENLLPVIKPAIGRKLDSQTIYRITLAYLRIKAFFKAKDGQINGGFTECDDEKLSTKSTEDLAIPRNKDCDLNIDHLTFQQSLDGCILVVSADGTIMYATENVQQFLGFQQVDLIHRCIYSIVHPLDQGIVRDGLENSGEFSYHQNQFEHWASASTEATPDVNDNEPGASAPFSCYCRLKCFNKNGVEYPKFHIAGKILHVPNMPQPTKTCSHVALLYCRPFLYSEFETKQYHTLDVFWSKHDLDLTFQDTEDTIRDILGYESYELCKTSLYQLVHPADLCLMVHVHKTILDVNEVQSFYLRLQSKGGNWKWLHCKGKVICKNSKKFSIVFTHKPLRDEDITFIEHETTLRRHFSASNLMTLSQPPSGPQLQNTTCISKTHNREHHKKTLAKIYHLTEYNKDVTAYEIHRQLHPYYNQTITDTSLNNCLVNDRINQLFNQTVHLQDVCPSTWHANSERHSPVLPSCHTAPKSSHRNKYRYLLPDRDKHHEMSRDKNRNAESCSLESEIYRPFINNGVNNNHVNQSYMGQHVTNEQYEHNSSFMPGPRLVSGLVPSNRHLSYMSPFYPYPPSPPPSPRPCFPQYWNNTQTWLPAATDNIHFNHHANMSKGQGHIESHASFKVSMVCNTNIMPQVINRPWHALQMAQDYPVNSENVNGSHDNYQATAYQNLEQVNRKKLIKTEPYTSQSCALTHQNVNNDYNFRQYDIEASVHMRIVEAERKSERSITSMPYMELSNI